MSWTRSPRTTEVVPVKHLPNGPSLQQLFIMATNLVAVAQSAKLENLVEAVTFAGLGGALSNEQAKLTLFAPDETVFKSDAGTINVPDVNRWNKDVTANLLKYHVVEGNTKFESASTPGTLEGQTVSVDVDEQGSTTVNGIAATPGSPYENTNGNGGYLIYSVGEFLVPASQTSNEGYTTTLFQGAASRLGDLAAYANEENGDAVPDKFYDKSLKELNNAASGKIFSADLAYKVFLPTQKAFSTLLKEVGEKVGVTEYLKDGGLETALKHHITTGATALEDTEYKSLSSTPITVDGSKVIIAGGEAKITSDRSTPAIFSNGQVYDIDQVLQFPRETTVEKAISTGALVSTVTGLLGQYGLVETLDSLTRSTVFAPTNDALNSLLTYATWNTVEITADVMTTVLKHHVVTSRVYSSGLPESWEAASGEMVMKSDIVPNTVDVVCTNGNIHIIDDVLIPPSLVGALPKYETVAQIAVDTEITSKLEEYVTLAGLVETLSVVEPGTSYTVFAPTDDAFSALSLQDLEYLTANNNEKLKEVLLYHVVPAGALSASIETGSQEFPTASGETKVTVTSADGVINVGTNGAKVVKADVKAFNGVVHVIDQVLLPPGVELPSSSTPQPAEPVEPVDPVDPSEPSGEPDSGSASSLVVSALTTAIAAFFALE